MLLAPHIPVDPRPLQPSSPVDAFPNPWGSFFSSSHLEGDRCDIPDPSPSCPDLDQQASQHLMRDTWSVASSPAQSFAQTQDAHLSPAAMFMAAFTPPMQPARLPDDEGETVAGYVLGQVIGRGGFSTIRLGHAAASPGGVVAIKIVRRSDIVRQSDPSLTRKRLDHETEIWSSLSHEHILPLFSVEHTAYADFYVTPYCPAGSLFDILKRDGSPALPHDDAGMMFRQVVRGVRYLHEVAGYVHRDIKLENVLVDEMGVCRICDYGLARKIGESDDEARTDGPDSMTLHRHRSAIHHTVRQPKPSLPSHASILRHGPRRHRTSTPVGDQSPAPVHPAHAFQSGSLPYAAPELLSPQTPGGHYGANPAQDMWALGCLLYALLTGRPPFSDPFEPRLTVKILRGVYDIPSNIGRGAARVLKGCIECDVSKRWTIGTVDEMAWDIGWGQLDESPVSRVDEFECVSSPSHLPASKRRPSRSLSRGRNSSLDPHSSRIRRSLSQTSVTTSSSLSTRSTSRSLSRPPTSACLPLAACDDAVTDILTTATAVSSSTLQESALMSPTSVVERGRSPKKADLRLINRFAPSIGASTARSEPGHELSRGRDMSSGTDVLDNTARWASALGLNTIAEVTTHLNGAPSPAVEKLRRIQKMHHASQTKRAESTPPVSSAWPHRSRARHRDDLPLLSAGECLGAGGRFLREPSATPIPIVRKSRTRSHSVGYEPDSAARRRF